MIRANHSMPRQRHLKGERVWPCAIKAAAFVEVDSSDPISSAFARG